MLGRQALYSLSHASSPNPIFDWFLNPSSLHQPVKLNYKGCVPEGYWGYYKKKVNPYRYQVSRQN
jgi:hypothetical protein